MSKKKDKREKGTYWCGTGGTLLERDEWGEKRLGEVGFPGHRETTGSDGREDWIERSVLGGDNTEDNEWHKIKIKEIII